ncbi:hypothetical protein MOC26_01725 [Bacillus spizizenii]|nr:hypothetical protein [Bacillus spizizenii]MCY8131098.1 hypothetical protein [Bacillus spizizenii]
MIKTDFNNGFKGFADNEKILLDTCVILALANEYDAWHNTVSNFFWNSILNDDDDDDNSKALFLFVNPMILSELTHLAGRPLDNYAKKHPKEDLTKINAKKVIDNTVGDIKKLIENDVFLVVDGNKETVKKQIQLYKSLGPTDAANVAIANEHGLNFLTVDVRLANNMIRNQKRLPNIETVYTTTPKHRTY